MSPVAYKSEMYEAMIELMNQDKISFTAPYDNKGYLTVFDIDEKKLNEEKERISKELKKEKLNEKEFENKLNEELEKIESVKTKMIKLDWQDEVALANMDALKEELEYRLGLRKLIQKYNPFNCWEPLKMFKPQHKNEICLSVTV